MNNFSNIKEISIVDENTAYPELPFLGITVPAGFPSPARDYIENSLNLNELLVSHPASTYFVRVEGFSMVDANILHDDILIVDRSLEIIDNQIVIAIIDGEIIVKRLKIKNNEYWLCPENKDYQAVKVETWMDFCIWGVVTWILHKAR